MLYERSPIHTNGGKASSRETPPPSIVPAASSADAPATGRRPPIPGNVPVECNVAAPATIAARPAAPAIYANQRGSRITNGASNASSAPAANSHALAGEL